MQWFIIKVNGYFRFINFVYMFINTKRFQFFVVMQILAHIVFDTKNPLHL